MLNSIDQSQFIHFIGIGGVSMSGIAMILHQMGYAVSGSDHTSSKATERLIENGISVSIGQKKENIHEKIALVVYTAAIKEDNPELQEARNRNIPCIERSEMLGELTRLYKNTIAICGTHGKTTTTSMISLCFIEAGKDPAVQVGADLRALNDSNFRMGHSDFFVIEACEYVRSFLSFSPKSIVLLNIEEDHLDYYKDLDDIKSAFNEFLSYAPEEGAIVYNHDDEKCIAVVHDKKAHPISFGIQTESDWMAKNIALNQNGFYTFDAVKGNQKMAIELSVPGYHHIYNALAAVAMCDYYGLDENSIQKALKNFTGASRRFEYVGTLNHAKIYDDYAHHPTEIKATIDSALALPHKKLWVVFQPHTYSRTITLFEEFTTCFEKADELLLLDIYAAREIDEGVVSSYKLAESVNQYSHNAKYMASFEEAETYLKEHVEEGDLILTIGAGNITKLGYEIKDAN